MAKKKLPVYKLTINLDDKGMDFMALVDYPAHGKNWITMNKQKNIDKKFQFNDEKQIVTGVAIAANQPIYKKDPDGFEYYVFFSKEDIRTVMKVFAKRGYYNNVNLMHDGSKKVKDAYLIESYFVNEERSNIPIDLKGQNIRAGSLIFSYWIEGSDTWKFVKENGTGFSLEGWFKEIEVKFKKNKKMSKQKKTLIERLGFKNEKPKFDKDNKDKYAESKTADGETVMWEGDLAEGSPLFIVSEDGEEMLAPPGDYALEIEGAMMVVTVGDDGSISKVEEAEEEETEAAMKEIVKDYQSKNAELEKRIEKLEAEKTKQMKEIATEVDEMREAFEKQLEGKTTKKVKTSKQGARSYRDLIK